MVLIAKEKSIKMQKMTTMGYYLGKYIEREHMNEVKELLVLLLGLRNMVPSQEGIKPSKYGFTQLLKCLACPHWFLNKQKTTIILS